jgi:hypothetical protein
VNEVDKVELPKRDAIKLKAEVDGKTTDERISRGRYGKLSDYSGTVGRDTETATGEKSSTVDTYSTQVPGSANDGTLQLDA